MSYFFPRAQVSPFDRLRTGIAEQSGSSAWRYEKPAGGWPQANPFDVTNFFVTAFS